MDTEDLIQSLRRKISAHLRAWPFLLPRSNRVAYVGPGVSTNMGDWAMFLAHQRAFASTHFQPVPPHASPGVISLGGQMWGRHSIGAICLGGGTLVGATSYRRQLRHLFELVPDAPSFMLGVGVEDPSFVGRRSLTDRTELVQWSDILRRFEVVNVRGPDSAETLADIGIDARVTGDPALLLGDPGPVAHPTNGVIGINVGATTELWGSDPGLLMERLVSFGRALVTKGLSIRLIPVWPPDRAITRELASRIGHSTEIVDRIGNLEATLKAFRDCDVLVGMKLHSLVFASCVFVPCIALEYRPKCADFQRSIGRSHYNIRTDSVDVATLLDMLESVITNRDDEIESLSGYVLERRSRLGKAIGEVQDAALV